MGQITKYFSQKYLPVDVTFRAPVLPINRWVLCSKEGWP